MVQPCFGVILTLLPLRHKTAGATKAPAWSLAITWTQAYAVRRA
jgi:hypothetical protein